MNRRAYRVVAGGVVVLLACLAYRPVFGYELLGWDTFPLILAAKVQSFGDLVGTFTEELMEGRYPLGRFYRPVLNLSIALDHAVWGLEPLGYHVTDFLILLVNGGAVFAVSRRLFGSQLGAFATCLAFLLHPLQFELLPVTARRADALAMLFTACAVLSIRPAGGRLRDELLTGFLVLMACGAKETGAVAAVCVVAWCMLVRPRLSHEDPEAGRRRLPPVLRALGVAFGALLVYLGARFAVLGELGGHADSSLLAGLSTAPTLCVELGRLLVMPQPLGSDPGMDRAYLIGVGLGCLACALLLVRGRRVWQGLAFLFAWAAALLVVQGVSGEVRAWYAAPLLPVHALLLGLVVQLAARALARRAWLVAAPGALVALALAVNLVAWSGLFHHYAQWSTISAGETAFLEQFREKLAVLRPGQVALVRGLPLQLEYPERVASVESAVGMSDYSAQAWVELTFPELPVRVVASLGQRPTADPRRIVIGVVPLNPEGRP